MENVKILLNIGKTRHFPIEKHSKKQLFYEKGVCHPLGAIIHRHWT